MTTPDPIESTAVVTSATRTHHMYGMSKLPYIDGCRGYLSSPGTSDAAEDGQRLHDIMDGFAEWVKSAGGTFRAAFGKCVEPLDDTDRGYLLYCCDQVDGYIAALSKGGARAEIHNEIAVQIRDNAGKQMTRGYLDLLLIAGEVGVLIDYKFGWVPVKQASENWQGKGYAAGSFQNFPRLKRIASVFIQPKLKSVSAGLIDRKDLPDIVWRIAGFIADAEFIRTRPNDPASAAMLAAGDHCKYCARSGVCSKLVTISGKAAAQIEPESGLPMPAIFKDASLTTPDQFALARHWVDLLEPMFDRLKAASLAYAQANGGVLETTLPDGRTIRYEVRQKAVDRVLGPAPEVAEALADIIPPERLMGAAKFGLGKLLELAGAELRETKQFSIDSQLKIRAEELERAVADGSIRAEDAYDRLDELKRELKGERLTKKGAGEIVESTLEARGLLSRPDTTVPYFKKSVTKQIK